MSLDMSAFHKQFTLPALIDREPLAVAEDKDAKMRHRLLNRSLEVNTSTLIAFSHLLTID